MHVRAGPLFFKNVCSNPFSDFPTKQQQKKDGNKKGQIYRPLNTFYGLSGLFLCWLWHP